MTSPSALPSITTTGSNTAVNVSPAQVAAGSAPVSALNAEHPEVAEYKRTWALLDLLYEGGDRIRKNPELVLRRKAKEIEELYRGRKDAITYQNVLGGGIDYYLASIFERDPDLDVAAPQPDGSSQAIDLPPQQKTYYDAFRKNADRQGTSLTDMFREVLRHLLLYQRSWLLIDLPTPDTPPLTLGEQQRAGLLDAYLCRYDVFQVVNWGETQSHELDWVVIRVARAEQQFLRKPLNVESWYYFDRTTFRTYERRSEGNDKLPENATLVAGPGPHALADLAIVPVIKVEVPKGLWLANRVLPQVLEHLNTDNEYGHALRQTNLSVPVISGNFNENPSLSEGGYLKIPAGAQFSWTEPPGNSFQRSEFRVAALREEIYRQMYLMAQGRSAVDTPAVQSGYAKQLEMRPAAHVQNYLGDTLRVAMEHVLNLVTHIRQDRLKWSVRGFDFTEDQADVELQRGTAFMGLQVQSPTAQRENQKRVVRARFKDSPPELIDQMCKEIDASLTAEQKAEADKVLQQQMMTAQFEQNMTEGSEPAKKE